MKRENLNMPSNPSKDFVSLIPRVDAPNGRFSHPVEKKMLCVSETPGRKTNAERLRQK